MKQEKFKAFVVEQQEDKFIRSIKEKSIRDLPAGDLLVKVYYSSLNYKDALSAIGNKGVTKNYPHTPGIDAVGVVVYSDSSKFPVNTEVIVTSYDLGMDTDGGFGQFIRVPESWAVKLPSGLKMKEAMILGTAGFTAGLSVLRLSERIKPDDGKIIVSGATGGVGSLSLAILAKLDYHVIAITGKKDEHEFLYNLGAKEIISRKDLETEDSRPMLKGKYAGAVDTVGGVILDNIIKSTNRMGVVTCCGNVASPKLNLTVFPFILRGVSLIGIGTQDHSMEEREFIWNKLAQDWKPDKLMDMYTEVSLEELSSKIDLILKGKLKGRTIINLLK